MISPGCWSTASRTPDIGTDRPAQSQASQATADWLNQHPDWSHDASGRTLKIRNRLVPVGDPMFHNFASVVGMSEFRSDND